MIVIENHVTGLSALVQMTWMSCCSRLLLSASRGTPLLCQISARHSFTLFSHSVSTAKTF